MLRPMLSLQKLLPVPALLLAKANPSPASTPPAANGHAHPAAPAAPPATPAPPAAPALPVAPATPIPPPKKFLVFLSCVAWEFHHSTPEDTTGFESYRDYLARELDEAPVKVVLQEDLGAGVADPLQALHEEILRSDLVVHLVGNMPGEAPEVDEVTRLLKRRVSLFAGKRALAARLQETTPISYTQWGCYLAWEHKVDRLVCYAGPEALRSPFDIQEEELLIQQFRHRRIIAAMNEPWINFKSHDHLCRTLWLALIRRGIVPQTAATALPRRPSPAPGPTPNSRLAPAPSPAPPAPIAARVVAEALAARLKTFSTGTGARGFLQALKSVAQEHGVMLQRIVDLLDTHLAEAQTAAAEKPGVDTLQKLAGAQLGSGAFEAAMENAGVAADLAERQMESDPVHNAKHRQAALDALILMADAALAARQPQAAVEALVQGNRLISLPKEPIFWADYHCVVVDRLLALNRPAEAQPYLTTILTLRDKLLGDTHPQVAEALQLQARVHATLNQWPDLAAIARRIVRTQNSLPAPRRTLMPAALLHLSTALLKQGLLNEAEPVLRQALTLHEQVKGPEHLDTLALVNDLAGLLQALENLKEAEPLYRRALAGFERAHGPDHADTLHCLSDFIELLDSKGELAAAETHARELLTRRERARGLDHADTLASVNTLAHILRAKGELTAAEPLYRRALAGCDRALGPEHPDTLGTAHNFAGLLDAQGDLAGAETLLRRALTGRERVLGPEHAKTLGTLNNLARLLQDKGDLAAAEPLASRAVSGARKTFGPNHASTKIIEENLADLRRALAEKTKK